MIRMQLRNFHLRFCSAKIEKGSVRQALDCHKDKKEGVSQTVFTAFTLSVREF